MTIKQIIVVSGTGELTILEPNKVQIVDIESGEAIFQ